MIPKKRKRPSKTSTNARVVLPAFKENDQLVWEKEFKVPKLFYYYNKHMGEIDRFNALVAAYTSQRACNRNWMPQFHWILDGSLSNAFKLCEPMGQQRQEHQKFLEQVIVELLKEGKSCRKISSAPRLITQPKNRRGDHDWQDLGSIRVCVVCHRDIHNRGFGREISGNRGSASRTRGGCAICKAYLCRKGDCVKRYHDTKDSMESIE